MTAVADYENIDPALREAGIWATVGVGIPVLTADKVDEFYKRVGFWERINGAYRMNDKGEEVRFTRADVERLVGLRTNASPHTHLWQTRSQKGLLHPMIGHRRPWAAVWQGEPL